MTVARQKARIYKMQENVPRIIEAILCLVSEAKARRVVLSQYDVVKSVFLADKAHLNTYGRPITFDNYVAMEHGPVPSLVYNFLKEDANAKRACEALGIDGDMPWTRVPPAPGSKLCSYVDPTREVDEDILSPTDVQGLKDALTIVKKLGFKQIRKLTHEDQAYVDAWEDDGGHRQYPMSYAMLFETPNDELAQEISFLSAHI